MNLSILVPLFSFLRRSVLIIIVGITCYQYIKSRKKSKRNHEIVPEDLSNYEKDGDGLYPWERDTDDSPKNIDKNAKRYINKKDGPKRGRWS